MVVAYKPVKVDESGFSTIEATFEQVNAFADVTVGPAASGKDAVNYLQGKTITFTISPSGMITDPCGFNEMVKQLGEEAFGGKRQGHQRP